MHVNNSVDILFLFSGHSRILGSSRKQNPALTGVTGLCVCVCVCVWGGGG